MQKAKKRQPKFRKILITRFPYEAVFSGEEVHTLNLAHKLNAHGWQVIFAGNCPVLLKEFAHKPFRRFFYWGGVSLVSFKAFLFFALTFPFILFAFVFLAFRTKFIDKVDLVYMLSFNEKIFLTPLLRLCGIPAVWVEHSRIGNWFLKNPFLFLYRWWSNFTPIISVSRETKKTLIRVGISATQIHFILNGIDRTQFQKIQPDARRAWQQKYKFDNRQKIGLITRLYPDKGVTDFLAAFSRLFADYPNLEALIVGEGPEKKILQKKAQTLPVRFLGKLPHSEIPFFLNSIDFFVLPSSQHDPFGLAPAEAMLAGKPVILTDVCGIATFIEDQKHALVVPAKDSQAIYRALKTLQNNPDYATSLAKKGQKLASRKFSLEKMNAKYLQVFQSVLGKL